MNKEHTGANARLEAIFTSANAALTSNPEATESLITRGWVHLTLSRNQEAIVDLSNAFKLVPQDATVLLGAAILIEHAGKSDVAKKFYNDAIKFDPDFADALYKRGMFFAARGQYGKGVLDIANAVRIDPEQLRQVSFLDTIVVMLGMSIPRQPKNVRLIAARGLVHMLGGDLQKAIADLDQANERDPNDALILLWRGRVHAKGGNRVQAIADLQKAHKLNPDDGNIEGELEQLKSSPG